MRTAQLFHTSLTAVFEMKQCIHKNIHIFFSVSKEISLDPTDPLQSHVQLQTFSLFLDILFTRIHFGETFDHIITIKHNYL